MPLTRAVTLGIGFVLLWSAAAAARRFEIAVVVDGPWARNADVLRVVEREITELAREDAEVTFPDSKLFVGDWTLATVHRALDGALADPDVDLVLALGVLASHDACQRPSLTKPVVAAGAIDPVSQGLPAKDGTSGIRNLAYVTVPSAYDRDLRTFLDVARFQRLTILVNRHLLDALPSLAEKLRADATGMGLSPTLVPVGGSAAEALAAIPSDAEAVYLMPLFQLGESAVDSLVAGINARRLPSFSALGENEVRRGVLGAATPDIFPRMSRRLAVTVHRIILGEDAGSLPTTFSVGEQLYLNAATLRAIDASPSWAALTEAEMVGDEGAKPGRQLSLVSVVEEATTVNRDFAAAQYRVSAAAQEVNRSRSRLLPQAELDATGLVIDQDRAASGLGSQAERTVTGTASLSQVLFSEPTFANHSIQKHLQRAREEELQADRLDLGQSAARAYLDVLRATTFERIRRENLRLTRHHLELARTRESVGASGRSDVLRWESELATNRKEAIDANSSRNLAEMELNRILNHPLEEPFRLEEVTADSSGVLDVLGRTLPLWENRRTFRRLREFLAIEAASASPEIARIDASLEAAARRESSAKRAFWLPSLGLQGSVDQQLAESGAGTEPPPGLDSPDETSWSVRVQATYHLFEGGNRFAERSQSREERRRLEEEKRAAIERIDQRVRAATHRAGASYAGIREARAAAEAARANLDLVADAYSRGAVPLIDLLDAQKAFVVAGEAADNSVYDFLSDAIDVERALGRFDHQLTTEEKQGFRQRLDAFLSAAENPKE